MPHNTPLRTPLRMSCPVRFRPMMIGIMAFTFMATNPVITHASSRVPPHMQDGAQKYATPQKNFPVKVSRTQKMDSDRVKVGVSSSIQGQSGASNAELSSAMFKMIALVNQERMDAGLTKLEMDSTLMELAGEKCWDMVRFNYFGHYSKRLGTLYDQLDRAQFPYRKAAENLIGAPSPARAIQTVLSSPAHRSNILNPRFRKIGVGIIKGGAYGEIIVQILTG